MVLKSIYASGSTGPFFDNHFMNKHDSSFAKKTDFLSRYLVLSEIRCARKKSNQKQEQNLLSKVFNLFEIFEIAEQEFLLDSLLSAWTFVYWNMNTRWKYFLNYYHRIFFLEIQITTVQRGVVFTGVELREILAVFNQQIRFLLTHSMILLTQFCIDSKTKKKVISDNKKSLKWLSDKHASILWFMNSGQEDIAVLFQRASCI